MAKDRHIALPPTVWGPIFWNTIHIVALGYSQNPTEEEKMAAKQFYESLQYVIPCPICRVHYKSNLAEMPVDAALGNRSDLIEWTWRMHNKVNVQLEKPEITLDQFLDHIRSLKPPAATGTSWMSIVGALALGVGVGFALFTLQRKTK
jgi:hypothetical protein